jgi:hypothetical protein
MSGRTFTLRLFDSREQTRGSAATDGDRVDGGIRGKPPARLGAGLGLLQIKSQITEADVCPFRLISWKLVSGRVSYPNGAKSISNVARIWSIL